MTTYLPEIENQMRLFFDSLSEKDRRRYAAVEAAKLDYGGIGYISQVLGCDSNTIRHGMEDVQQLPDDEAAARVRKKGRTKES
jgi:hypothetical protein